ncbi:hypothetical protein CBS147333_2889 [Penicillium roqueforti]|nr:hypothetical protein CBS147333_2889 [Penicillium roqueforti]KAI3234752.1 hypothetical protein CBS147310_4387 [Penicillium roqueforti]KAI3244148.1 hypothetical protein DTO012A9_5115 [Penicillium roqueforti]KAI3263348.1 hypothetical protein CBS147308_8759 [Penicillium roqueforti]KAI3295912.1 hypothetical protein DTO002I6_3595 [Penicillium roqueforti]
MYALFGMFGSVACIFLGDLLGRRKTIFIAGIVNGIGAIIQSTAFSLGQLIVGRIILGLGTGGIIATVSLWQSEVSKAENRGSHVSAFGVFTGSGLSLSLWTGLGMSFTQPNSVSWRFVLVLSLLFSSLLSLFIFALPESPRWLCKKGKWEEAREILNLLHNEDPDFEETTKQLEDIRISLDRAGNASIFTMFKMGPQRSLHRVILAAIPQMFLQMSGINVIAQYTPVVFEQFLGFDAFDSGVLAAASQFAVILGAICCSWTVDRVGRRKLMLISATMMSICFACLSGLLAHPENRTGIKAAAFFIYFYLFVYVLGFLGIPFLYASEVAVTQFRAPTTGLSTAVSWLFNFIVAEVTPVGFANIGWKYFLVYCCINALCVPTIYFFFPETAGRSLEEIDEIFLASNSIFDTVNVAKGLPKHEHRELYAEEEGKESSSQVAHIDDMGRRDEVA